MANRIHYGIFILTILLFATAHSLSAQSLEGDRILTGTLTTTFSTGNGISKHTNAERQSQGNVYYNIKPRLSYGKVNQKNLLVSYGIAATFQYEEISSDTIVLSIGRRYIVSPTLTLQKYVALGTRLYYTPAFNFRLDYGYDWDSNNYDGFLSKNKNRRYGAGADFTPLGFTYVAKPKLFLLFGLGNASLDYVHVKGKIRTESGIEVERHTRHSLTFNAFTDYFSFGIQKILSSSK